MNTRARNKGDTWSGGSDYDRFIRTINEFLNCIDDHCGLKIPGE